LFKTDWPRGVQYIPMDEWLQMRRDYHDNHSQYYEDPAFGQVCLFTFN
jgi:hypothetical protein